MTNKSLAVFLVAGSLFTATAAQADHNSVWGAGHANMPNDIHNSAIEDTHEEFLDLVQKGGGADSVNRYATDTDTSATNRGSRPDVSTRRIVDRSATVSRAGGGMSRGGSRR